MNPFDNVYTRLEKIMGKAPTKQDAIKKYLDGDLEKFLKRIYKYSQWEQVFSITLPEYEKKVPGITRKIKTHFQGEFPGSVVNTINVHRVLVDHYGFVIDLEDILLAWRIEYCLFTEIHSYIVKRNRERGSTSKKLKPKAALKELKARGFINVNDFEDWDKKMAHVVTVKELPKKLYYPWNFTWNQATREHNINRGKKWWQFHDVRMIADTIGIRGYTRISTPKDR